MSKEKILVSSCLLGVNCKYNGKNNYNEKVISLKDEYDLIEFCPEVSSGMTTPRVPCEIIGEKVINRDGVDCTSYFEDGAKQCLNLCLKHNIKRAILKERSPSCGVKCIYDGSFNGNLISNNGFTTRLLVNNNIDVISEEDLD